METILIDLDGTLADWQSAFNAELNELSEEAFLAGTPGVYDVFHGREKYKSEVDSVMNRRGFYSDLAPIEGAVEAIHEMLDEILPVCILSKPWLPNPDCVAEKIGWLEKYFGKRLERRALFFQDKTMVAGRMLIDDIPAVAPGSFEPVWEHVYFTQPYNKNISGKRRLDGWADWRSLFSIEEKSWS